jgi:hypothetical protein
VAASKGAMQLLIEMFLNALSGLGAYPRMQIIEKLAIIVHDAMSVQTRSYHNLKHIFYFDAKDPISQLAAIFHDIVYFQVDKGFHPELEPLVAPFIQETKGGFLIRENIVEKDPLFGLVAGLFNFSQGEEISFANGLNEFLSAVVMVELLRGFVSKIDILKIAICIEATIPFRGRDELGNSHSEVLKQRVMSLAHKHNLDCSDESIDQTLKLAVHFSNQDVKTFANPDVARFLDITWKLLPESNDALRIRSSYTIKDYRKALQRMQKFLANLNPENIFSQYLGTPPDAEFLKMQERATNNINIAVDYLRIKLIGMGILESLAEFTGGDAPLSLFTGGVPDNKVKTQKMNDFLPEMPLPEHLDPENDEIYKLLAFGRFSEESFDLKNSPLSLFIYLSLSSMEIDQLDIRSREFFEGRLDPGTYINLIPRHLLLAITKACASLALTRKEELLSLSSKLNSQH